MSWVNTNKILNSSAKANALSTAAKQSGSHLRSRMAISMYNDAPDGEISLEEFERYAVDRLQGMCCG